MRRFKVSAPKVSIRRTNVPYERKWFYGDIWQPSYVSLNRGASIAERAERLNEERQKGGK